MVPRNTAVVVVAVFVVAFGIIGIYIMCMYLLLQCVTGIFTSYRSSPDRVYVRSVQYYSKSFLQASRTTASVQKYKIELSVVCCTGQRLL